jgi:protein-disulfide isomerase
MITRRQAVIGLGALGLSGLTAGPALAQSPSASDVAVPGPLGDIWIGAENAKVTVIEYASLTCSHCATFHANTYPAFKAKYVDTGKVRFTLREFPLDPLAMAGFMLSRCNGNDRYYPLSDLLFSQQKNWAFVDKPVDALMNMVKQAGFTQESFEACLKRQDLYDAINAVKNRGSEKLGVSSTPTFFINGKKHSGALTLPELEKIIDPIVAG